MAEKQVRMTIEDLKTGETEVVELGDDYMLICAGNVYLDHTQAYANGTHILTIKRDKPADATSAGGE